MKNSWLNEENDRKTTIKLGPWTKAKNEEISDLGHYVTISWAYYNCQNWNLTELEGRRLGRKIRIAEQRTSDINRQVRDLGLGFGLQHGNGIEIPGRRIVLFEIHLGVWVSGFNVWIQVWQLIFAPPTSSLTLKLSFIRYGIPNEPLRRKEKEREEERVFQSGYNWLSQSTADRYFRHRRQKTMRGGRYSIVNYTGVFQ